MAPPTRSTRNMPEGGFSIPPTLRALAWAWFRTHEHDQFKVKVWGIPISITVGKARVLWEFAFGPESGS